MRGERAAPPPRSAGLPSIFGISRGLGVPRSRPHAAATSATTTTVRSTPVYTTTLEGEAWRAERPRSPSTPKDRELAGLASVAMGVTSALAGPRRYWQSKSRCHYGFVIDNDTGIHLY